MASRHSDVVTAGRLRFTIVIAQLANAVQMMPLNSNKPVSLIVQTMRGAPSTIPAMAESSTAAKSTCQNTS